MSKPIASRRQIDHAGPVPAAFAADMQAILRAARCVAAWCVRCRQRAEQRRALAELDEHGLRDVGITSGEARAECAKPWWRA
ncbi:MAG: DUF1127 domain-containing protein [Alphaproteobacteria bacterium]